MVGKASGGPRTSSLTSLVPRQVMLESCAVVAAAGGGDKLAEKRSNKRRKGEQEEKRSSPVARAPLLRAIASFLESGGFTRTLAALRSEAQLEIDDGSEDPAVDLEEIICNYLESSKDAVAGNITGPEEQFIDAQNEAPMEEEEEGIRDHSEEPIRKKKKKKANGADHNVKTESEKSACDNGMAECHLESKDQKSKKSKKSSKETIKYVGNENLLTMVEEKPENLIRLPENASSMLDESNIRSKEKKKKKKVATDSPCGVDSQDGLKTSQEDKGKSKESGRKTDSQMPTIATENATSENPMREDNPKSKDKKKRNHNLMVERSSGDGVEVQNGIKMDGRKKGKSVGDDVEADAKGSNPNIENIPSSPNTVNIDKKAKKRKRSAAEETELHVDNAAAVQESKQDLKEGKNKAETQERKKSENSSKETVKYVGNENLLTMVEEKSENLIRLPENAFRMLDESNIRFKEKKKKNKLATDSPCGVDSQDGLKTSQEEEGKSKESGRKTDSQMPTIATENATNENPMRKDNPKSKDKKKRNHNLIVERSSGYGVEVQNGINMDGGKKGKSVGDDAEADAKGSNPNVENIPSSPNTVNIDKKAKKRKRSAAEETELHVDNAAAVQESKQDLKEGKNKAETQKLDDSLLNSELHASGKKKKSEDNFEKSANTPANKESKVPWDANGTPAINGSLGNNEQEGNGPLKSKKAELKHSAEPNAVNAFQRVKIDQVKFADERLQDNSYWAKNGAESGYGAKAQEILGQVRGRDFRHEKTKKKRGSYRGGLIDFQSHSVKFKYSDDEE